MKKFFCLLFALCLLLTGCSFAPDVPEQNGADEKIAELAPLEMEISVTVAQGEEMLTSSAASRIATSVRQLAACCSASV